MIAVIILFLLASFFLSGSETALTAANRARMQSRAEENDKRAKNLLKLTRKPDELITAILIGNNISNIMLPTLVTVLALNYNFSVGIATAILTFVLIIFAEVLPKSIAATFADKVAYIVAPVIAVLVFIFKPLTFLLNSFTRGVIKLITRGEGPSQTYSREEIKTMVDVASSEGTFEKQEQDRIKRVIDFYRKDIRDVLKVPRMEITGIPIESSFQEVRDITINHNHTRYPVYNDNMDHIVGVFHAKLLLIWAEQNDKTLNDFIDNNPLYVVETNSVDNVFKRMLNEQKHLAVVLDEYGGTMGMVTQEDIIEAMIGQEIEDEHDTRSEQLIEELTDEVIICDGKLAISRFNEIFNTRVEEEEDIIAGLLYREFDHIPEEGETFQYENLHFEVLTMDNNQIKRVRVVKEEKEEED